ncbi:MAG: hypothetical protein OHK0038_23180 [Flammeovirgaceae bacterium]
MNTMKFLFKCGLVVLCLFLILTNQISYAQGERNTINVSGIVVEGDSSYGIPGVHIYIPKARIGTITNSVGFFSLPTQIGDTLVISAVGYKSHQLVIPGRSEEGISVLIDMQADTTMLPIVEVYPYPTKELFKEAFLALELPDDKIYENFEKNLDQEQLSRIAREIDAGGGVNYRYYMNQQIQFNSNKNFAPTFSFLNPFAWAQFIKSIKRGDLKKKN